jgi:hypothetical protein
MIYLRSSDSRFAIRSSQAHHRSIARLQSTRHEQFTLKTTEVNTGLRTRRPSNLTQFTTVCAGPKYQSFRHGDLDGGNCAERVNFDTFLRLLKIIIAETIMLLSVGALADSDDRP